MNRENFLFKTIPISDDQFAKITDEIKNYHEKIVNDNLKPATATHRTVYSANIGHMMIHCRNLLQYIISLKCTRICGIKFVYAFPGESQTPHVDYVTEDGKLATESYLGLNFPVKNCERTRVYFCEPIGKIQKEQRYLGNGLRAKTAIHDNWKILDGYHLTTPTLINTNVYHNIENKTDDIRISVSIRFEKDPWHLI